MDKNLPDQEKLCTNCHLKDMDPLNIPEKIITGPHKNISKKSFMIDGQL